MIRSWDRRQNEGHDGQKPSGTGSTYNLSANYKKGTYFSRGHGKSLDTKGHASKNCQTKKKSANENGMYGHPYETARAKNNNLAEQCLKKFGEQKWDFGKQPIWQAKSEHAWQDFGRQINKI